MKEVAAAENIFILLNEDLLTEKIFKERRSRDRARHTLSLYDAEMPVRNNTLPH